MSETLSPANTGHGVLFKGTSLAIKTLKPMVILVIVVLVIMLSFMVFGPDDMRDTNLSLRDAFMGLYYLGVVYAFLHFLGQIVESTATGDPFVSDNAKRLRHLGWLFLAIGVLTWVDDTKELADVFRDVGDKTGYGSFIAGFTSFIINPALILASPLMFILARVFDAGIAMREDVEGTV